MNRLIPASALLACALLAAGCYSQRLYSGAVADPARLESQGADVFEIDGKQISIHSNGVLLSPGKHELRGSATGGGLLGPADKNVEHLVRFEVKPGGVYYAKGSSAYGYCVWVQDAQTREVVSSDDKGCGVLKMGDRSVPE